MDGIEELVRKLPPELQQQVVDFVMRLLRAQAREGGRACARTGRAF